jgi:hypothetical protein
LSIRFAQLSPGAHFDWRGRRYSKVSPLEGADLQSGERRLVPRSARVELVSDAAASASPPGTTSGLCDDALERAVDSSFARLHRRMEKHIPPLNAMQRATLETLFREARIDLLGHLGSAVNARPAARAHPADDTES